MNYGQVLELDEITLDDCDTYLYGLGKRVVINAGIEQVIVKDKNEACGYRIMNVQDWIDYDEVLEEKVKKVMEEEGQNV